MTQAYPPEPWLLRGRLRVAVWLVPTAALPPLAEELYGTVRPVRLGGRTVVGTAWVEYGPGGVLEYNELLCAVLVRSGPRPRVSIMQIWVDSIASRDGGRALWGIPKELARFRFAGELAHADVDEAPLADATVRQGPLLPGRWRLGFRVVQSLRGAPKTSPVRATARLSFGRSQWTVSAESPLRYLAGRRPVLTMTASEFRMTFGEATAPGRS
jgi:Acetoacetate decarboxylase (ADC)